MGLGTLINVICVVAGGLLGVAGRSLVTPAMRDGLLRACGISVVMVGISGAMQGLLSISGGSLTSGGGALILISLVVGSAIGEALDLEGRLEDLGEHLRKLVGAGSETSFVEGFVTASLTVSVGAMAIVGAINDGVYGDWSTLALKGMIDLVTVCAMASSLGIGCAFAALPVAVIQGLVTLAAQPLSHVATTEALQALSTVGSILIVCVGINLLRPKTFRPASMLPSVVIAILVAPLTSMLP